MQLDNTRIAIRERGLLETLDLALQVLREFATPILYCTLLAIIPLAVLNYALIGWMADVEYDEGVFPGRFLWNMSLLVYLEAPLSSLFVVALLGPTVFMERPTLRQVLADVLKCSPQLVWCQLLLRAVLPAWLLLLTLDRYEASILVEYLALPGLAIYATIVRGLRPYINEIILLEKNPLRAKKPTDIAIGKRSEHLHGPSSGDLFVRWVCSAAIALLLTLLVGAMLYGIIGILISNWSLDWYKVQLGYPLVLWLVAGYFSVVRFLNYLDLRIRHEGWEVELLMRAEAIRIAGKIAT